MSKIINPKMKGRKLTTSLGMVEFDETGVAEVSEEQSDLLSSLGGYDILTEDENSGQEDEIPDKMGKSSDKQENQQGEDKGVSPEDEGETLKDNTSEDKKLNEEKETPKVEKSDEDDEDNEDIDTDTDILTEDELSKMNVPQLKKVAKENDIDLNGATKKDDIIPIILGAINN